MPGCLRVFMSSPPFLFSADPSNGTSDGTPETPPEPDRAFTTLQLQRANTSGDSPAIWSLRAMVSTTPRANFRVTVQRTRDSTLKCTQCPCPCPSGLFLAQEWPSQARFPPQTSGWFPATHSPSGSCSFDSGLRGVLSHKEQTLWFCDMSHRLP